MIDWIPSPNYGVRRSKVDKIIIHHTNAKTIESTLEWFKDPKSQCSAHYLIGTDGRIVQMVDVRDVAWHCYGNNSKSIGIEVVHVAGNMLDAQEKALRELCDRLLDDHDLDYTAITAHREVTGARPTLCPGDLFDEHGDVFQWAKKKFGKVEVIT